MVHSKSQTDNASLFPIQVPTSFLALMQRIDSRFESNHNVLDRPSARLSLGGNALSFAQGQSYDISLWLDVPETPENAAVGNVMFGFDLLDEKNATSFTSARPFLLPQRSSLVQTAYLVPRLPLLTTGWWQERRKYQLYLATHFVAPYVLFIIRRIKIDWVELIVENRMCTCKTCTCGCPLAPSSCMAPSLNSLRAFLDQGIGCTIGSHRPLSYRSPPSHFG